MAQVDSGVILETRIFDVHQQHGSLRERGARRILKAVECVDETGSNAGGDVASASASAPHTLGMEG